MKNKMLLLLVLICVTFSASFISQTTISETYAQVNVNEFQINSNSRYNSIQDINVITGTSEHFFIYDANKSIKEYKNNTLTTFIESIENVIDMKLYNDNLYILQNEAIFKIDISTKESTLILSALENCVAFCVNNFGVYVALNDKILIHNTSDDTTFTISNYTFNTYDNCNITKVKSITECDKKIYAICLDEFENEMRLIKIALNNSITSAESEFLTTISYEPSLNAKIEICENDFLIQIGNKISKISLATLSIISNNIVSLSNNYFTSFTSGEIKKISTYCYTDKLIICDNISHSIQSFNLNNNQAEFDKLLIASFGYDNDRLHNASDVCLLNENNLLIADYGNKRIINHNLTSGDNQVVLSNINAKHLAVSTDGKIYVVTDESLNIYTSLDDTTPHIISFNGSIVNDIALSAFGNAYLIDITNKQIVKFTNSTFTPIANFSNITNDTRINCDASGRNLYVLLDGQVHIFDIAVSNNEIDTFSLPNSIDFALDYKNNIYTLKNDTNIFSIEKYTDKTFSESIQLKENSYNKIFLSQNYGTFYVLNGNLHKINLIETASFTENLSQFTNDVSYFEYDDRTDSIELATIKENTQAFKYPFIIDTIQNMNVNDMVIVLKKNCEENLNFSYCLIINKEKKNILAYIQNSYLDFSVTKQVPNYENVQIITQYAYAYSYPTSLEFDENGIKNNVVKTLYKGEIYNVNYILNCLVDAKGIYFYEVQFEDGKIGYIKKSTAMDSSLSEYTKTFQPDASIKLPDGMTEISTYGYDKVTQSYTKKIQVISDNTRIKLINKFDTNVDYTLIAFIDSNDEEIEAYVETKYVYYDNLTTHKIVGFVLFIVSICLIIIIGYIIILQIRKNRRLKLMNEEIE